MWKVLCATVLCQNHHQLATSWSSYIWNIDQTSLQACMDYGRSWMRNMRMIVPCIFSPVPHPYIFTLIWIWFCLNFYILPSLFVLFFGMPSLNLFSASHQWFILVSWSPERESLVHCPYKICSNTHRKWGWAITRYAPWSLRRSAIIAARASSCLSGSFRVWLSHSFSFCFFFYDSWRWAVQNP